MKEEGTVGVRDCKGNPKEWKSLGWAKMSIQKFSTGVSSCRTSLSAPDKGTVFIIGQCEAEIFGEQKWGTPQGPHKG